MKSRISRKNESERADDYRRKRRRPPPNPEFARILVQSRQKAEMSQVELAREAEISPRTVAQVEKEGSARAEMIIRLAAALHQPPEKWLEISGHPPSDDRIRKILSQRNLNKVTPHFTQFDPASQFNRMLERIKKYKGGLMCSFVTSQINIDRTKAFAIFPEMFEAGLHLALVCPYPLAERNITLKREYLSGYYGAAYQWTRELAKTLRGKVPDHAHQISVFSPRFKDGAILVAPPIGISANRPAFIRYGLPGNPAPPYEVGAYLPFANGQDDQWIQIYDSEETGTANAQEAFHVWRDYCFDIVESWDPNQKAVFDPDKLFFWEETPTDQTKT